MQAGGQEKMDASKWAVVADELKVPAELPGRAERIYEMYKTYLAAFETEEKQHMQHTPAVAAATASAGAAEPAKPLFRSPNALPAPAGRSALKLCMYI